MARKGENIYKRKDGRYEGRYIKDYDLQGKGIIGYVYGKTYKEAKEKLLIAKAKVKERYNKPPSEMLAKDWFEKWLSNEKIKIKTILIRRKEKIIWQQYRKKKEM